MSEGALLKAILGFEPLVAVGYPTGYGVLYAVIIALAAAVAVGYAIRTNLRSAGQLRLWAFVALLVSAFGFVAVRQLLIVDYQKQGIVVTGEESTANLVVPLPFPGFRSEKFVRLYAPQGGPLYRRLSGIEMREIVFEQQNFVGTYVTIALHLLTFAMLVSSFFLLSGLGARLMLQHFTDKRA